MRPSPALRPWRAFTLIELLVVISLIALLMAILLPTLGRARKQAKTVGCQANLRQSGIYFAAYAAENNGRFNPHWDSADDQRFDYTGFLSLLARPSSGSRDVLRCPTASQPKGMPDFAKAVAESFQSAGMNGDKSHASAWARRRPQGNWDTYVGSYGINICTLNIGGSGWGGQVLNATTDVRVASNVPVYLDCVCTYIVPANWNAEPPPYEGFLLGEYEKYTSLRVSIINRHDGGINGLFLDWSARKVGLKEIWTLKWTKDWNTANRWTKAGGVKPEDWPEWMRGFKDY